MPNVQNAKYEAQQFPTDLLCDSCQSEIPTGQTAYLNQAAGTVHCETCASQNK